MRLLHELKVHQVELEMQNEELARSRIAAEAALESLTEIYDFAPVGYLTLDARGTVRAANLTAAKMLGVDRSRVTGVDLRRLVGKEAATRLADFLRKVFAGDDRPSCELDLNFGAASSTVALIGVLAGAARGALVAMTDVTDRRRADELERRLLHADRLAAIGHLASGIAHEVNNPLAYVTGNLQILDGDVSDLVAALGAAAPVPSGRSGASPTERSDGSRGPGSVPALLANMKNAVGVALFGVERIKKIVKNLRSFSRLETDALESVNLNEVVETACSMAYAEIRHRAALVKKLGDLPTLVGDRGKLTQVLTNLIVNAAQSIEEGAADRNKLTIQSDVLDGRIRVVVEDSGRGMSAHVMKDLFRPFFTTKPRGIGTGLGLSISAEIVRQHAGEIRVSSVVGRGSRFEVLLPVDNGLKIVARASLVGGGAEPRPAGRRGRILVIDDESHLLAMFAGLVRDHADVVTAEGGVRGLEILRDDVAFDMILCDVMMPTVDGMMVFERLRATAPALLPKLVFMTGGAFTARSEAFVASDGITVLAKPIDFGDLKPMIDRYRQKARAAGP